jgi:hypothetical protein
LTSSSLRSYGTVIFGWASGDEMPLSTADLYATGVTVDAGIGANLASRRAYRALESRATIGKVVLVP